MKLSISLIISTYNWEKALLQVLNSTLLQSTKPNEIIIADDGSKKETAEIITKFKTTTTIPIIHIWQEDKGFRLSKIRNKAIKAAKYEYIIQIDGDTILHKDFIKDHSKFAQKNTFISGSRVLLNSEITQIITTQKTPVKLNCFNKHLTNKHYCLHLPFINLFSLPKKAPIEKLIFKVRGCNMSFWKKDLLDINGYNEDFIGWGREDSELAYRLLKKGIALKRIKFSAIQYHLFHNEANKNDLVKNDLLLEKNKNISSFKIKNGIIKL